MKGREQNKKKIKNSALSDDTGFNRRKTAWI